MYGAGLIEALRRIEPSLEFFGVGGEKMRAAGCDTVVDAKDLSVVGITEILSHLPKIWRLFRKLIAEADKRKPDLAIVIDSPAFNWRVARQMKKRGIPVVYYVCPQFWAWRQGRVRLLRKYVDKALVIFPFEEKFYRDRGVDAEFVGHPLAEMPRPTISRDAYAAQYGLDAARQWITLMPGSRVKEVRMNLPGILAAAGLLGKEYEFLLPVAPTLDTEFIRRFTQLSDDAHVRGGAGGGTRPYTTSPVVDSLHVVPDGPACPGAFARRDHRQRHRHRRSCDDGDAVCHGVSRYAADISAGAINGQGAVLRHGESDRGRGSGAGTGAGGLHCGAGCRRD